MSAPCILAQLTELAKREHGNSKLDGTKVDVSTTTTELKCKVQAIKEPESQLAELEDDHTNQSSVPDEGESSEPKGETLNLEESTIDDIVKKPRI